MIYVYIEYMTPKEISKILNSLSLFDLVEVISYLRLDTKAKILTSIHQDITKKKKKSHEIKYGDIST